MNEIETLNLGSSRQEALRRRERTPAEKWLDGTGLALLLIVACLAIFYQRPRFVLLICFPTFIPFIRVLAYYARNFGEAWMRKLLVEFISIHALVLLVVVYLWRTVPHIRQRADYAFIYAFLIVSVEGWIVASLLHFQRPKTHLDE